MIVSFTGKREPGLTYGDVPPNGFFVDTEGQLCQRYHSKSCTKIANKDGRPYSLRHDIGNNELIRRLVPVDRIAF